MRLPRLSIAALMALVGLIALGVAALRSPALGPHADSLGGPYLVTTAVLDLLYRVL